MSTLAQKSMSPGWRSSAGLPWSEDRREKDRLKRITLFVTPLFLLITIYISWVDLPAQKREDLEALPPQLAKVILKKKEKPKPVIQKKEEPKPEPVKPEKVAEKPKPVKPEPKIAKKPEIKATPKQVELAREKAKNSGLLAMQSQLSKLAVLADSVKLDTPKTLTAKPIAAKASDALAKRVAGPSARSAGVDESQLNTETQTLALAARAVTEVPDQSELEQDIVKEEQAAKQVVAARSSEDVRRTMDQNKSAIYSIYNRALRKKPSLRGVVTPELIIEENGVVSSCSVVESTLNEPALESKICNRLRLVNFGAKPGVDQTIILYPIELLPG